MNDEKKYGEDFQRQSRYIRNTTVGEPIDWTRQPEIYKAYPDAPKTHLPAAVNQGGAGLWEIIQKRKSHRDFRPHSPMSREELSQILWASQGITHREHDYEFRAAPSAGALYPVETYLVLNNVAGLQAGIYHYHIPGHSLECLKKGDFRTAVAQAALEQDMCIHAMAVFIWTAVFHRCTWKYHQRAYRYIYLDAGHIGHAVALAAECCTLGSCHIAAFYDDEINELVGVDGMNESAIYMTAVGRGSSAKALDKI